MARDRDPLLNFERMRREMDELIGDVWGEPWWQQRPQPGFSPRVDVFYCSRGQRPLAVVVAELAGIRLEEISLEISALM